MATHEIEVMSMQFVPYRIIRNQPTELRERLKQEGELVVTSNGEPMALLVHIEPGQVEEALLLVAQLRAQQSVSAIRKEAQEKGLDRISADVVEEEIQAVRASRAQDG
jgi:antitoxin (DNA-binding transcriptional repressor) of toxin-antitoxin stability system